MTTYVHNRPRRTSRSRVQRSLGFLVPDVPGQKKKQLDDGISESARQKETLEALLKDDRVAFAFRMNTGSGFLIGHKDWKAILAGALVTKYMARFIKFAFPGCSDILGMLKGGRFFACECKSATGELSEDQAIFLAMVNQHGGLGFIARGIKDVLRHLSDDPNQE